MSSDTKRTINLYCPSLSKLVQWGSCDFEHKLDLGSIARAFGLDPHTLKLNGHFISRGLDFIASSVTWKSMFSFFSARGLSTGLSSSGPLVVDGKLSRVGAKRMHDPENTDIGAMNTNGCGFDCLDTRLLDVDSKLFNAKRLKDNKSEDNKINSSLKRRLHSEDQNSFKRARTNGTNTAAFQRNVDCSCNTSAIGSNQLPCSFIRQNMKREREDEMLLAGPSKRLNV